MVTIAGHTACSVRGINSWNPVWKQRSLSEDTWQSMMLQCWIVRILCYCPCSWPLWLQDGNVVKFVIRYCDCIASSRGIVFSNMCCGTEGCSISTCFPRCGHCCSNLSESCRERAARFRSQGQLEHWETEVVVSARLWFQPVRKTAISMRGRPEAVEPTIPVEDFLCRTGTQLLQLVERGDRRMHPNNRPKLKMMLSCYSERSSLQHASEKTR